VGGGKANALNAKTRAAAAVTTIFYHYSLCVQLTLRRCQPTVIDNGRDKRRVRTLFTEKRRK